jgi:hypothetical protein
MKELIAFYEAHGTKVLGTVATIVAGLVIVPDLIPVAHVKWWHAANVVLGALTIKRGFYNGAVNKV